MRKGTRVKLKGRRVRATVLDFRAIEDGCVVPDGKPGLVLLEFDKPVRYGRSSLPFTVGWFDVADIESFNQREE